MGTGRSNLPKGVTKTTSKIDTSKFKIFTDKPINSRNYPLNAKPVTNFFSRYSNANSLISGMPHDDTQAFYNWSQGSFMGNNKLRYKDLAIYEQEWLKTYDKYIDQSVLTKGIVVKRLASFSLVNKGSRKTPTDEQLKNMEGNLIKLNMPLSTAAAAEGLTIGIDGKNVEYAFHIPPSTGACMWIGDQRINGWGARQREVMINRDVVVRQGKAHWNPDRQIYEIDLYYEGRTKHTYK